MGTFKSWYRRSAAKTPASTAKKLGHYPVLQDLLALLDYRTACGIVRIRAKYAYYADNLDILQRYIRDESVDLIYLDPPFNSNATYNVLFAEQDGTRAAAQIKAFEDTWQWDQSAAGAY